MSDQNGATNNFTNPQYEWCVLGSVLREPELFRRIPHGLFTDERCRFVFDAYREMDARGVPLEEAALITYLELSESAVKSVGGVGAIIAELNASGSASSVSDYYLVTLRQLSEKREAYKAAEDFWKSVQSSRDPFTELEKLSGVLDNLRTQRAENDAPLVSLMDIAPDGPDTSKTLLGNRFLCVGGSLLFVGPSGIGKSSASVQQDMSWSLGREAFGIRPTRPLRILTIQAENDSEDLGEMREGVCRGLKLSADEREQVRARVFYETESGRTGSDFLAFVESRVRLAQFDLLRLDPLMAFLGADVNDAEKTARFLRNGLNPLLTRHGLAGIVNHHTPKVTNRDTSGWRGSDWMYAGAGSADITNWCRAALVIDPTHTPHVFRFIAAKRGNRIGWVDENGEREFSRYYCHASDGLYWRAAEAEDLEAVEKAAAAKKAAKPIRTVADMKALVPMAGAIPKKDLLRNARDRGFTARGADEALATLVADEELFVWHIKRPKTNAEVRISRQPQTLLEANG